MKKPKTTTGGTAPTSDSTIPAAGSAADAGPEIRRIPAHVGVIDHAAVGAGTPAQAGQPGEVRPVGSTLVGDGTDGLAPAAARSATAEPSPFAAKDAEAPKPRTAPADSASPRPAAAPVRKTGFWPVALGGVVAAGLGAAATIYALPHLPAAWQPAPVAANGDAQDADPQAMIDAAAAAGRDAAREELAQTQLDAALPDDLLPRIEALEEQVAALSQAPAETPAPEADTADADAPDADTPVAAAPAIDPDQLADLRQRLDEQQARLDELSARPAFDPEAAQALQEQIETAAAEAQSSLDATRAEAEALQEAAAESTRRAEAVAAIAALQTALDAGVTPEQARTALEGAGLDTPDALQTPVPSLTELQTDFPEAARAALRASLRDSSASGQGNLLTNFLRAQTGARSVAPRDGDDADAILSRADADVQAGRIDAALTQMQALPQPAMQAPAMADWMSRATAYSQARAALTDLSSGSN
ncbi:MAG: COG4223 family protein [Paracoccus hibiscisoli]|uniref:COG4223 family protein n=1 Tax=Paracoccus hibiscisoli TaxID=2023261 RepID=UPI003919FDA9